MMRHRSVPAALALVFGACGSPTSVPLVARPLGPAPMRSSKDASFRNAPPPLAAEAPLVVPEPKVSKLSDGTTLWILRRTELPVVAIHVVSDRGAERADPAIAMLFQNAALRSAVKITSFEANEKFNALGADVGMRVGVDRTVASVSTLAATALPALDLFGELLRAPAFRDPALAQARTNLRTQIGLAAHDGGARALEAARASLYPDAHRLSRTMPHKHEVAPVQASHLETFHTFAFQPEHTTVIAAGDLDPDAVTQSLEKHFAGRPKSPLPEEPPLAPPPPLATTQVKFLHEAGAPQATIVLAWVGPPRGHPDATAFTSAGHLLAGRLHDVLRVEHGWTYSVADSFGPTRSAGMAYVSTAVDMAHVTEAMAEIRRVVDELPGKPPSSAFLESYRSTARTALVEDLGAVTGTASLFASLAAAGRTVEWLRGLDARLQGLTPTVVAKAAEAWLPRQRMCVIVVGEAAAEKALAKMLD